MRARNIKPSFFKNEELASLPFEARLLFIGLWCMADRSGRLENRPLRIKAELFPYDSFNVQDLCLQLEQKGFISIYQKDKNSYIQIINFEKHQFPHHKEKISTIPAQGKTRAKPGLAHLNPDVLNPESPILNPDIGASREITVSNSKEPKTYKIPEPTENPAAAIVMYYKAVKKHIEHDDRTWDREHWARGMKAAKDLLGICLSYEAAKACIDQFSVEMERMDRSWTLETVKKWAHDWKTKQGGKDYGATNSTRFFAAVSKQRTEAKFDGLRKISTAGEILNNIRDLQNGQPETDDDNGSSRVLDEGPLQRVGEKQLEEQAD